MSFGPFGKRTERLPVDKGGTDATTPAEARRNLDVPSVTDDNHFYGDQVFDGDVTVEDGGTTTISGALVASGSVVHNGDDPAEFNSGIQVLSSLTLEGASVLVDAPSDGSYYVRKDGAWVAIVP